MELAFLLWFWFCHWRSPTAPWEQRTTKAGMRNARPTLVPSLWAVMWQKKKKKGEGAALRTGWLLFSFSPTLSPQHFCRDRQNYWLYITMSENIQLQITLDNTRTCTHTHTDSIAHRHSPPNSSTRGHWLSYPLPLKETHTKGGKGRMTEKKRWSTEVWHGRALLRGWRNEAQDKCRNKEMSK